MGPGTHLSVRARLTLVATAASVVTLTIAGLLLYRSVSTTLDSALTDELEIHATDVRDEVERGVPPSLTTGIETQVLAADGTTVQPAGEEPLLERAEIAQAGEGKVIVERVDDGRDLRVVAVPADAGDGSTLVVASAASTTSISRTQGRLISRLLVAGLLMVGVTTLAAWLLSSAALRPVRSMSRRARTLSTEDPDARLPVPPGADEIAELGVTLNDLLGRIASARARERAFIDDASHEMRAPLAVMRGELELALLERSESAEPDSIDRALTSALEETDRLARLTDHLLVLARADAGMLGIEHEPIDLVALVKDCSARLPRDGVGVEVVGPPEHAESVVEGSEVALEQLVTNLLVNAYHWARTQVRCDIDSAGDDLVLRVSDDGPGFPTDYLAHAFDRFRRGDPARGRAGTSNGLGLGIAAAIVTAHHGHIDLGNESTLGGAWVEVTLPLATVHT